MVKVQKITETFLALIVDNGYQDAGTYFCTIQPRKSRPNESLSCKDVAQITSVSPDLFLIENVFDRVSYLRKI